MEKLYVNEIGPDGEVRASYRKLHMFDVEVDGVVYAESDHEQAGREVVVSELTGGTKLGMSICYDLRFPELYRELMHPPCDLLSVPAAFTYTTGLAHWELLLLLAVALGWGDRNWTPSDLRSLIQQEVEGYGDLTEEELKGGILLRKGMFLSAGRT